MRPLLPAIPDREGDLDALRRELAPWRHGLEAIAARHQVAGTPRPVAEGSLPVFAYPGAIVKLYAPDAGARPEREPARFTDFDVERSHLQRLAGALPVPTPVILAEGELDRWRYVVMQRLRGRPIEALLHEVDAGERAAALQRLGAAVRALHDVPHGGLRSRIPDFEAFIESQRRDISRIEAERGAPGHWVAQIDPFLERTPRGLCQPVLLHTELGPGHVLAEVRSGAIELTGLIDFVDAMAGDPEYDFAAVAFFVTAGDGGALAAFLDGYGWEGPRGAALAQRLMRYLLLHRFAPLGWLLARRPPGDVRDLATLAERWLGCP